MNWDDYFIYNPDTGKLYWKYRNDIEESRRKQWNACGATLKESMAIMKITANRTTTPPPRGFARAVFLANDRAINRTTLNRVLPD